MSKKEQSCCSADNASCIASRRGAVGGQAIIEGVMMKSKKHTAIAVRRMDNKKIVVTRKGNSSIADKCKIFKWPIIRGVVNFVESMILSFSTITEGTEMLGLDTAEEDASKVDKWIENHAKWLMPVITVFSVILGLALALGLFIFLPTFIGGLFFDNASAVETGIWRSVVEGVVKIILFIAYIWLTALIPDMKRVYMHHGAEHKSIFCYEAGLELNIENVRKQSRFHPRCGTSFMFAMLLLSIFIGFFLWWVEVTWLRSVIKLAILPITVGIGYEFIRYAGRHDNKLIRILAAPGLWMQRLTTKEPDDSMIEVAITSLKCALPDDFPNFYEDFIAAQEAEETAEEQQTEAVENPSTEENLEA